MPRTRRLDIRLSEQDVAVLDTKRGSATRSAYIRNLIHGGRAVTVRPDHTERSTPTTQAVVDSPHEHQMWPTGRTGLRGTTEYREMRCSCGAERWDR